MSVINNYNWTNLHENVHFPVERFYTLWNRRADGSKPDTFLEAWNCGIAQIQAVLKEAATNNKKVRMIGGGWSLSDILQTGDYFVNPNALSLIQVGLKEDSVQAHIDGSLLCLSQCGACVMDINEQLRLKDLALSTSGASDGQSIVGAFSTGTHGSAFQFGAMPDFVEALHIIVSDSLHYWVEGSQQVVTDDFITQYMPGATRINEDAVLNSAIVSFGSFGAIHAVLIKVEPIYELERYQKYYNWEDVKICMNGPGNFDKLGLPIQDLYHFSVVVNPYKLDSSVVGAMKKTTYSPENPAPTNNPGYGPSNEVLRLIGTISRITPSSIPSIMKAMDKMIKNEFQEKIGEKTLPGWIFTGGIAAGNGKAYSVEIGIDANNVLAVTSLIFEVCQTTPFPGLIGIRYIKKTKATLGFTKFPITCSIEMAASYSNETMAFYKAVYEALDNAQVEYTFHWGQCNNLNNVNLRTKYGGRGGQ